MDSNVICIPTCISIYTGTMEYYGTDLCIIRNQRFSSWLSRISRQNCYYHITEDHERFICYLSQSSRKIINSLLIHWSRCRRILISYDLTKYCNQVSYALGNHFISSRHQMKSFLSTTVQFNRKLHVVNNTFLKCHWTMSTSSETPRTTQV